MTISLSRIAPIVLANELFQATLFGRRGSNRRMRIQPVPSAVELPRILGCFAGPVRLDAVPHRKADVILSIRKSSDLRDCPFGNNLGDKNHTPPVLIAFFATDVESQVYLVKIGMKGNTKRAEELCLAKLEAHQADVRSSVE